MSTDVRVTYYDTAMALIEIGSVRLLTDPVLDGAGTVYDYGVTRLTKTHPASTTAAALGRIDAVLLSHDQHGDNLDHGGRALLAHVPQIVTTPEGAARLGGSAIGLAPWDSTRVRGPDGFEVRVTAAPAQHGPDGTLELTGPVTGFLLDWTGRAAQGPVYLSGDTVPFAGTREIIARAAPVSLALLNLGHVKPDGIAGVYLSLSAAEAADYAAALGARHVVPLHFDGWAHFGEARAEAVRVLAQSPIAPRVRWLDSGDSATFAL